jgi:F-type H+-transporting ATPase subunit epsilon
MAELDVALVAADREVWSGKASLVVAKTTDGDVGVMPGHQPILSLLKPSVVTVKTTKADGTEQVLRAAVHGGFISVADNRVSLLSEAAELSGDIDTARAEEALSQAQAGGFGPDSEAAADRARLRLRAAGRGE